MAQAERKEMVTNDLVKGMNTVYEGMRKGPSRGTIITLGVVVGIVLIVVAAWYFWNASNVADSKRWLLLDEAIFPEQLDELLDEPDLKDSTQLQIVRFKEARMKLALGLRDLGSNESSVRKKAHDNVEEAKKLYEELAKSSTKTPQLHQEALWAAAKAYEALAGGDNVREAIKLYQTLQKEYPASALGKDAKKQLDRLDNPQTKKDLQDLSGELSK